jgi:hypothetical protein
VALSKIRVIAFEGEVLLSQMGENPALGFVIMQNIASLISSRLRKLEHELAGLLHRNR